jgi:hypothetical protein
MKHVLNGLLAATSLTCLLAILPASAQTPQSPTSSDVSCSSYGSDGLWPPYAQTKQCVGAYTPASTALMRNMLTSIGQSGTDAAARLQAMQLQTTDDITITVNDPSLTGGTATIRHYVVAGDNSYTVLEDLVKQFNALNTSNYYSFTYGNSIQIYANPTAGPISFSSAVLDDQSGIPVTETMTTVDNGDGTALITLGGTLAPYQAAWFDFGNWNDFVPATDGTGPSFGSNTSSTQTSSIGTEGFSLRNGTTNKWSTSIFETTSSGATPNLVTFTTAHETGHIVDNLYGSSDPTSSDDFSNSTEFKDIVALDEGQMNAQSQCAVNITDAAGYPGTVGGALSGLMDGNGNYYCSDNGNGTSFVGTGSGSNTDILALTYSRYSHVPTDPNTGILKYYSEIFADSYAATLTTDANDDSGNPVTTQVYVPILQDFYLCTSQYVQYLTQNGIEPSNSILAQWGGRITQGAGSYTVTACDGSSHVSYWHFGT